MPEPSLPDCQPTQIRDAGFVLGAQDNDEKLRLLEVSIAHLNDIVLITEADPIDEPGPRIVYVNEAFVRRTGYTAAEVLGRSPRFLQGPKTQREALDRVRAGMTAMEPVRVEIINYAKDGSEFWLEMEVVPVKDAAGRCTHFVAIERDVTSRKEAEARQLASEAEVRRTVGLLRAVTESIPDAVFVKDLEGRYLLCNEGAAKVMGRAVGDVVGQDDSVIFDPEGASLVQENDREVMASGEVRTSEEVLTSAGLTRTFLATKAPYRDNTGAIVGMVGISRDITERKLSEEKLREQATLLDKATDAILVRGLDHRIQLWNRGAERVYGWLASEVMGRSIRELLYRNSEAFDAATAATLAKGEWSGELQQCHKAGKVLDVECHWTLVRDDSGQPKSILAINTDVTNRKKLEQQFLRAQRMESIGTLAGGVAHDLNNVLSPIVMAIAMLRSGETSLHKLALLEMIEQSAERGAQMVKQVLTFARGVDGRSMMIQMGPLVREVQKICNETFLKNIQVKIQVPWDLWPVMGDPTQLHQVLLNLCVNARDAMPRGGTLTLTSSNVVLDEQSATMSMEAKPGPHVMLQVEDTGGGMSPELMDRIFEPFFTTKETGKGTGLGLSTTQAIVNSHGGFIKVNSEVGVGTRFQIYLPAQTDVEIQKVQELDDELPRGNGELVLVVDDEASVREITRQTLETFGYKALVACDGAEASATYAERKGEIAVVLTDMMMPVMDGPTMIQVLVRMNPNVCVLAASGLNADAMVAKAAQAGARHFLPKPYTAGTLLQALKEALSVER